jgi:hypothetical protein
MGSAYWSALYLPIPYPLPFGSSVSALFRWLLLTMIERTFTFVTHGFLLDGCQLGLLALPPFIPASRIED